MKTPPPNVLRALKMNYPTGVAFQLPDRSRPAYHVRAWWGDDARGFVVERERWGRCPVKALAHARAFELLGYFVSVDLWDLRELDPPWTDHPGVNLSEI